MAHVSSESCIKGDCSGLLGRRALIGRTGASGRSLETGSEEAAESWVAGIGGRRSLMSCCCLSSCHEGSSSLPTFFPPEFLPCSQEAELVSPPGGGGGGELVYAGSEKGRNSGLHRDFVEEEAQKDVGAVMKGLDEEATGVGDHLSQGCLWDLGTRSWWPRPSCGQRSWTGWRRRQGQLQLCTVEQPFPSWGLKGSLAES